MATPRKGVGLPRPESQPSVPARAAAAASRNSIPGSSPSTHSMAGVRTVMEQEPSTLSLQVIKRVRRNDGSINPRAK